MSGSPCSLLDMNTDLVILWSLFGGFALALGYGLGSGQVEWPVAVALLLLAAAVVWSAQPAMGHQTVSAAWVPGDADETPAPRNPIGFQPPD